MPNTFLQNDCLLRTLRGEHTERTPVWIMRQAGRYLPEYRAVRARQSSFMQMCKSPDLATELTLQPLERYPLDAAILFSDILTVPEAMGMQLSFVSGKGPVFARPLRTEKEVTDLRQPEEGALSYVYEAIRLCKTAIAGRLPLIGFCGSPFTLAAYMVEGQGAKQFAQLKELMFQQPVLLKMILEKLTEAVLNYCLEQAKAGVDVLQIFDSWGGILSTPAFKAFSLAYTQRIISGIRKQYTEAELPIICFTKNASRTWYALYREAGATAVGIDWRDDLSSVALELKDYPLQGNLDPYLLCASPKYIRQEVEQLIQSLEPQYPHIFNLGHGIPPSIHPDQLAVLIEAVREFSTAHKQ